MKSISKVIVYIDCVSSQDSTHLLRIKALSLMWRISVIQLCVFYFRNVHWLITFETPVRMLNSFLFFHLNSCCLPHRTSAWDHLEILSRFNLFQQSKWIWEDLFCKCADVHNYTSLTRSLWNRTVVTVTVVLSYAFLIHCSSFSVIVELWGVLIHRLLAGFCCYAIVTFLVCVCVCV